MNKGIGIALLVVGIVLIVYGFNASDSASSGISRFFTGAPTNKALWLLLGGLGSAIVGAIMMFRTSGKA
jgi:ABC-type phosphate transport system permease subunit